MNNPTLTARILCCASLLGASLLVCHPQISHARPEMGGKNPEGQFATMDADKDGKVSSQEFFIAYPQMKEAAFEAIDKNKDKGVTFEEWEGFTKGHGADAKTGEGAPKGMPPMMGGGMPSGSGSGGGMPPAGGGMGGTPAGAMPPMMGVPNKSSATPDVAPSATPQSAPASVPVTPVAPAQNGNPAVSAQPAAPQNSKNPMPDLLMPTPAKK